MGAVDTTTKSRARTPGSGLAGAAAAGFALGLTELFAGLFGSIPSALSSVGAIIVERSPNFVVETAISALGTADKGVLAVGTALIVVILGIWVGRASVHRAWTAPVAFFGFALLGAVAAFDQPFVNVFGTIVALGLSSVGGVVVLRALLHLAGSASPADAVPQSRSRRTFVAGVAGVGGTAAIAGFGGRRLIIGRSEAVRSATPLTRPSAAAPPPGPGTGFEVPGLESIVVPNRRFYRIDTALIVPRPNPESWTLTITGLVDREIVLNLDDLMAMPLHEEFVTIACVSNEVGGDLVGNAKWTGVPLEDVLDAAGIRPGAGQVVGRSVDGWTAGFPTDVVHDDRRPLIAIGMNDEPLPARHGFPARLIVPGLYGYVSATKWLEEIELTTWDGFDGYWVPRGWSKRGPIKTQSRIDVPRRGELVNGSPTVLAGVAWAPLKGIETVEVSIDSGPWQPAELSDPLSDKAWVQWRHQQHLAPGNHVAQVRATDGTGLTQTGTRTPPAPNGATGWHAVAFRAS
ncbi:MAG: molybdopterin-dependent oxidoreductase [Acidimicrobiia bacterium]